jgi:hypothetical protein
MFQCIPNVTSQLYDYSQKDVHLLYSHLPPGTVSFYEEYKVVMGV